MITMNIIYVDDEYYTLQQFVSVFHELLPDQAVTTFNNGYKALEYIAEHRVDIAFLDISMVPNGIELAKMLRFRQEDIKIVFLTAFNNYAAEAFAANAVGYLLKPVDKAALRSCLLDLGLINAKKLPKVYFRTMPDMALYVNHKQVLIRGNKGKEILAYLVNARGRSISTRELLQTIWENEDVDNKGLSNVRVNIKYLLTKLQEWGIEHILISSFGEYALDTRTFTTDVQELEQGSVAVARAYDGRYLEEYSWAEENNGYINQLVKKTLGK